MYNTATPRLASILERAETEGKGLRSPHVLSALDTQEERELAMIIAEMPEVIGRAARSREPHQLAFWLMDTCRAFHAYYSKGKVDARVISRTSPRRSPAGVGGGAQTGAWQWIAAAWRDRSGAHGVLARHRRR